MKRADVSNPLDRLIGIVKSVTQPPAMPNPVAGSNFETSSPAGSGVAADTTSDDGTTVPAMLWDVDDWDNANWS